MNNLNALINLFWFLVVMDELIVVDKIHNGMSPKKITCKTVMNIIEDVDVIN